MSNEKLENGSFSIQDFKALYDDVLFIGLTTDRDNLYERINKRFDSMLIDLIDEVTLFFHKFLHQINDYNLFLLPH